LLQQLAQRVVDQCEQHDPGIGLDAGDHPFDLTAGTDHAPHVFHRLHIVELHETGSGNGMNGLAGRVGDQVKVKPGHDDCPAADRNGVTTMGTASRLSTAMLGNRRSVIRRPRIARLLNQTLNRTGKIGHRHESRGQPAHRSRYPRISVLFLVSGGDDRNIVIEFVHISTGCAPGSPDLWESRGTTDNPRHQPTSSIYHLLKEHLEVERQTF
jgi:hypothetical protein